MSALRRTLHGRGNRRRSQPLSKLEDHLLDDLGITREQAHEIDREDERRARSRVDVTKL
ncbi:DUF1127 domain-containing protein [Taklimakanibacter deserti]|uniref:DUF1127 domain-containing protein n=1 Tax=Taklimakanibacter deserti TaxID=2267839 RepID=UPI000E654199